MNDRESTVNNEEWLENQIKLLRNSLRVGQTSLADWKLGSMAVSAVPGAGKSHSLSIASCIAIAKNKLHSRKQLIIVTYTRSAAANIKIKIRDKLKELKLPPGGFAVHTLHGLALQIASSHKELSGLNLERVTIAVPTPSHQVIKSAVNNWIKNNSDYYKVLLEGRAIDGEETEILRRQSVLRTEILPMLTHIAVREAKSSGLRTSDLREFARNNVDPYQTLTIASDLYQQYQELMRARDFIDYDDMILGALKVLEYPATRMLWQNQVFGVFEDEAQDSSPLQEKLITILASSGNNEDPNLIRVGDPNQAINSTFTPADPIYFNWFCSKCQEKNNLTTMDRSGRSSRIILDVANFVLDWANSYLEKHYLKEIEDKDSTSLFRVQDIYPVDKNDPQPSANPKPEGKGLEIYRPNDIYQTVELIGKRIISLLKNNSQHNAAILVRENRQGRFVAQQLAHLEKEHQIKIFEVGETERYSQIPLEILKLLHFLDRPHSPDNLKTALEVLLKRDLIPNQDLNALATYPEQFLYPTPLNPEQKSPVIQARKYCCNLLQARIELPHYQLIPFLGMTLQYKGSELATVQKLSEKINLQITRQSSLENTIKALEEIVTNEKFEGVSEDTEDIYTRTNQITIITMHKAKGLDWDYVFIPFLHENVIPGKLWVPVSAKFIGDFTLAEVARAQIRSLVHDRYSNNKNNTIPEPIEAWKEAEKLKTAEEFRLLYVAITRAKRLLWLSAANSSPFSWGTFKGDRSGSLQSQDICPVLEDLIKEFPDSVIN